MPWVAASSPLTLDHRIAMLLATGIASVRPVKDPRHEFHRHQLSRFRRSYVRAWGGSELTWGARTADHVTVLESRRSTMACARSLARHRPPFSAACLLQLFPSASAGTWIGSPAIAAPRLNGRLISVRSQLLSTMRRLVAKQTGKIGRPDALASLTMPRPATRETFGNVGGQRYVPAFANRSCF